MSFTYKTMCPSSLISTVVPHFRVYLTLRNTVGVAVALTSAPWRSLRAEVAIVDEQLMESVVIGQLGMKRGHRHHSLARADDPLLARNMNSRENLDRIAHPRYRRSTNKDRMHRRLQSSDVEFALE